MKNDRLRWSFFKWRIDIEDDVANFWKTNNSNFSSQIDFVNCSLSLIQKRSARRVSVCVCVYCVRRKMRIKSVVCEKDFYSVEFKDFCFLKSILELIVRSLVNIKRKERNLLRWRDSNIFYFTLSFKHFFIQSYFNFNCYFFS